MSNELLNLNELLQVLMDLARDIEENYKGQLAASGHYTTQYTLIDSVKTQVITSERGYEVTMNLRDYWKYVEDDTKPHFPPMNKILEWIEIKPIFPKPGANGIKPTPRQLAYLIARKISIEGTKGSHDLQKAKDAIIPSYRDKIAAALQKDMRRYIIEVFDNK